MAIDKTVWACYGIGSHVGSNDSGQEVGWGVWLRSWGGERSREELWVRIFGCVISAKRNRIKSLELASLNDFSSFSSQRLSQLFSTWSWGNYLPLWHLLLGKQILYHCSTSEAQLLGIEG